jgi:hypothetical protein
MAAALHREPVTGTHVPVQRPTRTGLAQMPSARWYWIAGLIAVVTLLGGASVGFSSYRGSQRHLDSFARVSIPGTATVDITEATGRVIYYEGDATVRFEDLSVRVTDPSGATVGVSPYDGVLVYETTSLTTGTAIATFTAARAGAYTVTVDGIRNGQVAIGDSFARRALPGVLTGLGIIGAGFVGALVLALVTFIRRSKTTTGRVSK